MYKLGGLSAACCHSKEAPHAQLPAVFLLQDVNLHSAFAQSGNKPDQSFICHVSRFTEETSGHPKCSTALPHALFTQRVMIFLKVLTGQPDQQAGFDAICKLM